MKRKNPFNPYTLRFYRKDVQQEFEKYILYKKRLHYQALFFSTLFIYFLNLIRFIKPFDDLLFICFFLVFIQIIILIAFRYKPYWINSILIIQKSAFILFKIYFLQLTNSSQTKHLYIFGWIECLLDIQLFTLCINIYVKSILFLMFLGCKIYQLYLLFDQLQAFYNTITFILTLILFIIKLYKSDYADKVIFFLEAQDKNWKNLLLKVIGSNIIIFSLDPKQNQFYLNSANDNAMEKNFDIKDDATLKVLLRSIKVPGKQPPVSLQEFSDLKDQLRQKNISLWRTIKDLANYKVQKKITLEKAVFIYLEAIIKQIRENANQFTPQTIQYNIFLKDWGNLYVKIKITIFDPINLTLALFIEEEQVQEQIEFAKQNAVYSKKILQNLINKILPYSVQGFKRVSKLILYVKLLLERCKMKKSLLLNQIQLIRCSQLLTINNLINFRFLIEPEFLIKDYFNQSFNFPNFFQEIISIMQFLAKTNKQNLVVINKVFEIDKIISNEKLLATIIINLMKNAFIFSPKQSDINLEISIEKNLNPMQKKRKCVKRLQRNLPYFNGGASQGMIELFSKVPQSKSQIVRKSADEQVSSYVKLEDSLDQSKLLQDPLKQVFNKEDLKMQFKYHVRFEESKNLNQESIDEVKDSGHNNKEKQMLIKFVIKNYGKKLDIDPYKQIMMQPKTLQEIEHNLTLPLCLGLPISRAMLGLIGPYEKIFVNYSAPQKINNIAGEQNNMVNNEVWFYIYSNTKLIDDRFKSSIIDQGQPSQKERRNFESFIY